MIKFRIQDFSNIIEKIKNKPNILKKDINEAIKWSIFKIERETKLLTPVDTGRLRASFGGGAIFRDLYGEIGTDVKYAIYVHEGYYKHKTGERKFFENAIKKSIPEIERVFNKKIEESLK